MNNPAKFTKIAALKSPAAFQERLEALGIDLPCDHAIQQGDSSPLLQPLRDLPINGRTVGNRIAIHPMEGWDGTTSGGVTPDMQRRWRRFGESGAKLIFGGEAMAVRPDGRANPNQLILNETNLPGIAGLVEGLRTRHRELYGKDDDLAVGFQMTHSGRFCRPHDHNRLEPRIAYRHPLLDKKFGIDCDEPILGDAEVERLIEDFIRAATVAAKAGADFVDLKHCHGYLLHEFLSARVRPGKFGGSFENRTRIVREIVAGIRAAGLKIDLAVRLSAFDLVPFRPDPAAAANGKPGPGIPENYSHCLPYRYAFGVNEDNPVEPDLREPALFLELCAELGIKLANLSAGSPYYNPHIQRPAAFPPSDGYQPAHDPLIDVARQINVARQLRKGAPAGVKLVGTGYTYLQEFLPHVAQAAVREGWIDFAGLGRMALSYPAFLMDAIAGKTPSPKLICRTFSDCTTAPRNGLASGCYPLDKHYTEKPEFKQLKALKGARPD
jgi:2,4-dienoyl-CoA reductase-like NADH-dependent reductase (Old Yellow Enzyme family)